METTGDTGASISESRVLLIPHTLDGKRLKLSMPLSIILHCNLGWKKTRRELMHCLRVGHLILHRASRLRLIELLKILGDVCSIISLPLKDENALRLRQMGS